MKIDPRTFLQLDRREPPPVMRGVLNPLSQDQAALARRKAAAPLLASKPQQAADFGLFGDSSKQTDLCDLVRGSK